MKFQAVLLIFVMVFVFKVVSKSSRNSLLQQAFVNLIEDSSDEKDLISVLVNKDHESTKISQVQDAVLATVARKPHLVFSLERKLEFPSRKMSLIMFSDTLAMLNSHMHHHFNFQ